MQAYYFRFQNEAQAMALLSAFRITDDGQGNPAWATASHDHALDVIGTLYKATGKMLTDEDGNQYPEMAAEQGFHVNLLAKSLPPGLQAHLIHPVTPSRVWA